MELVTSYDMYALIVTCPTLVILFCYNNSWTYILYTLVKSNVEILYFTGPGRSGWEKWFSGIYSHISKYIMFIQKKKNHFSIYVIVHYIICFGTHLIIHDTHAPATIMLVNTTVFVFYFLARKTIIHTRTSTHSLTHKTRRHQRHNSF